MLWVASDQVFPTYSVSSSGRGNPGSIPSESTRNSHWTEWHRARASVLPRQWWSRYYIFICHHPRNVL